MSYRTEPKTRFHKTSGMSILPVLVASAAMFVGREALARSAMKSPGRDRRIRSRRVEAPTDPAHASVAAGAPDDRIPSAAKLGFEARVGEPAPVRADTPPVRGRRRRSRFLQPGGRRRVRANRTAALRLRPPGPPARGPAEGCPTKARSVHRLAGCCLSVGLHLAFGALAVQAQPATATATATRTVTLTAGDAGDAQLTTDGYMAGESGTPSPHPFTHHADTIPKARLKSLTVTPVTGSFVWFKPKFSKGHRGPYTVWVTHDATEVTLDAVATWEHARVEMPEDVDEETEGTQVEVPADAKKVYTIKVFTGPKDKPCREDLDLCRFYSLVVRRPGSAVTGELEKRPSVTDGGSLRYRFRVKLSAPVELPLTEWESNVFTLTNGTITAVKRVGGVGSGPNGDPVAKSWNLKVKPTNESNNTVVAYTSKSSCTVTGAVCTVGGLKLGSLNSVTFDAADYVPKVSIADAEADLEDGEIEFTVSMTKASNRYAYVEFRTIDSGDSTGTATPGEDYRPQTTKLVIPPGKKEASAGVALMTDSETAIGRTIKVRIEDARLVNGNETLYTLPIGRGTATGVIESNRDCPVTTATHCNTEVGISVFGRFASVSDRDWYRVEFESNTSYRIRMPSSATDADSEIDPDFFGVHDDGGTLINGTTNADADEYFSDGDGGSLVYFQSTRSGVHYLSAGTEVGTGRFKLTVTELVDDCSAYTGTTCSVTVGGSASGELEFFGDRDWHEVQFVSGTEYRIDLKGKRNDASLTLPDPYFYGIYDNNGTLIDGTTNDDGIGTTTGSRVTYTATRTGAHYLSAGAYIEYPLQADNAPLGTYELEVTDTDSIEGFILPPLDGVTPDAAAAALLGEGDLTQAQLGALDRLGNANGSYDLGDVLSWIDRCRRGDWDCGKSPSSAAVALPAARKGGGTSRRTRRDSRSRTAGRGRANRRRSRDNEARSRRPGAIRSSALSLLLAAAVTASCTDEPVRPPLERDPGHQSVPGYLTVQLTVPSSAPAIGAVLVVEGPAIDSLRAPDYELILEAEPATTRREVIIAGSLSTGPLLEFHVPDRAYHAQYRVQLLQVSGEDYALRDPSSYEVSIRR